MSPITRVVQTVPLSSTERIDVVRQNGEEEVLLSIHESRTCIDDRRTIRLTLGQASKLSLALSGIASTFKEPDPTCKEADPA